MQILWVGARSVALLVDETQLYYCKEPYTLFIDGVEHSKFTTSIASIYNLSPSTQYKITVVFEDESSSEISFTTAAQTATLNVKTFGAIGDGVANDTNAIQAAISCCPNDGHVFIPKGDYLVSPLFLKSHISIEIEKGATLLLDTNRNHFPIIPGKLPNSSGDDYTMGTWEGEPQAMYASLLNGIDVEDVQIYGEGTIDGQAQKSDWWVNPKTMRGAWRGRMLFLLNCKDFTMHGIHVKNSPSWNIHPNYSENLRFIALSISAPSNSPNTDGLNPESCSNVLIAGVLFDVGDDCIAIKSGKMWMGRYRHKPSEQIEICYCLMQNGHGGVTVGSEMSGGVKNITVHHCSMLGTDRGLRIKTRRGRGENGVIDNITFDTVYMNKIKIPFTANCFYFCDSDGHSDYVQSREIKPIDESTPKIGSLTFKHVNITNCNCCACYLLGLPEMPIESATLEDVHISYSETTEDFMPIMADGVYECRNKGIIAKYVDTLILENVVLEGCSQNKLESSNVKKIQGSVN